jgi:viologen exporter family transport system permease protein
MNALQLYLRYVAISLRGQMQYRASFLAQASAQLLITAGEFLGLAAVFQRFKQINGWTLAEVALFYGIIGLAFAIAEAVPRGFDLFNRIIRAGDFDRLLLRPRSTTLQILGMELQLMRIGRFSQALVVLIWASNSIDIHWTASKLALLVLSILGGACLFSGLFVLQATLCFWTVESIEIVNCTTYGGVEAAQFPVTIYRPWFRHILTWVIPLATINYLPAHAILGRVESTLGAPLWAQWAAPLVGVVFLFICLQIFQLGVRRYTSTGS